MKGLTAMVCCAGLFLMSCGAQVPMSSVPITETPRVACVGDSITQGFGGNSYVEVLRARGEMCYENFGVCGSTTLASAAPSYAGTQAYTDSLAWGADATVIMLGTNDTAYWQGQTAFEADYAQLVDSYLENGIKVLLCTPLAPAQGLQANSYGVNPAYFEAVNESVHRVAAARDLPVAEVYAQTVGADMTLADGIHPNAAGAEKIADIVGESLNKMMH